MYYWGQISRLPYVMGISAGSPFFGLLFYCMAIAPVNTSLDMATGLPRVSRSLKLKIDGVRDRHLEPNRYNSVRARGSAI